MSIATVVSITGRAWARDEEGNMRELRAGSTLQEGETLITSDNGSVQLDFDDGLDPTRIGGGEEVAITDVLSDESTADAEESSAQDDDIDALLAELDEEDGDLLEELEDPAAGAGGGGADGGGHDFVRLSRITETVDPASFSFGDVQGTEFIDAEGEALPVTEDETVGTTLTLTPDVPDAETGTIIDTSPFTVVEGNDISLTVTTSTAPSGSPLEITLSNGAVITIPAGETSGSTILDSREDDFYRQGTESNTISVVSATGGGFDEIDLGEEAEINVVDDNDVTNITLSGPRPTELPSEEEVHAELEPETAASEDGSFNPLQAEGPLEETPVSFTAAVDNPPQGSDLTLTLSATFVDENGEPLAGIDQPQDAITVTIPEDATSTNFQMTLPNAPDGGATLQLAVIDAEGGNYEATDASGAISEFFVEDSTPDWSYFEMGGEGEVNEAGLPDGTQGESDSAEQLRTTEGWFGISTGRDDFASLTVSEASNSDNSAILEAGGDAVTIEGQYGTLEIALQGSGDGYSDFSWTYTLNENAEHETQGPAIDDVSELFNIVATDNDGSQSSQETLTIDIVDDVPSVSVDGDNEATEGGDAIDGTWSEEAGADGAGSTTVEFGG
ncbi:retention module-containing protein, partial [Aidingimonas halophila]